MATMSLPKSVKQVVVLGQTEGAAPAMIYGAETKKKSSKFLRPIEKAAYRLAQGQAQAAATYLERHKRSNAEEKNGWISDLRTNIVKSVKAGRKAAKAAKE